MFERPTPSCKHTHKSTSLLEAPPADAQILDIYAYEEDSGAVVASGKKSWPDSGTREFRDLTGE